MLLYQLFNDSNEEAHVWSTYLDNNNQIKNDAVVKVPSQYSRNFNYTTDGYSYGTYDSKKWEVTFSDKNIRIPISSSYNSGGSIKNNGSYNYYSIQAPKRFFKIKVGGITYSLWDNNHYEAFLIPHEISLLFHDENQQRRFSQMERRDNATFLYGQERIRVVVDSNKKISIRDSANEIFAKPMIPYRIDYKSVKIVPTMRFGR